MFVENFFEAELITEWWFVGFGSEGQCLMKEVGVCLHMMENPGVSRKYVIL